MNRPIAFNVLLSILIVGVLTWGVALCLQSLLTSASPPVDGAHAREWVACLSDPDPAIRRDAYMKVFTIGEPAIPFLIPLAESGEGMGEEEAVQLLLHIRSEAAVPALVRMLKTGIPRLRREAIEALGRIGPPAQSCVPELERLCREGRHRHIESVGGCRFLAQALARIRAEKAVPILIEMLENSELRRDAAMQLESLGASAHAAVPIMERLAQEESDAMRDILLDAVDFIRLGGHVGSNDRRK